MCCRLLVCTNTGGWGSLEYTTSAAGPDAKSLTAGQLLGGRWRPLQYFFKQSLYADVMATCGAGGRCYVKNDGAAPFIGSVVVTEIHLGVAAQAGTTTSAAVPPVAQTLQVSMPAGPGATQYFTMDASFKMDADHVYDVAVHSAAATAAAATTESAHLSLHMAPKDLHLAPAAITTEVLPPSPTTGKVAVVVSSNATALYVTLTSAANGRFEDNAFWLTAGNPKTIGFVPFAGAAAKAGEQLAAELKATLRTEHLGGSMTM